MRISDWSSDVCSSDLLAEFASVALEVAVIDGIEPRQRGEQAHIGFGDGVAHQETLPGKTFGEPVEASEQRVVCLVVRLLWTGETAAVDAVVDVAKNVLGPFRSAEHSLNSSH